MTNRITKTLMGVAALAALALGGSQLAGAASSTTTTGTGQSQQGSAPQGNGEAVLTGDTADKVKAAILAKLPGATVQRMSDETDGNGTDAYEAHVTKADGTRVEALLDKSFTVTSVKSDRFGGRHRGGPGRGPGGSGETPLTGDTLTQVKSAVEAKLPGSTVDMASTENDGKSTDAYEAHVTKADGTRAKALLDKSFTVTAVNDETGMPGGGGH